MKRIAIIRIHPDRMDKLGSDLVRLSENGVNEIEFLIPCVKAYVGNRKGEATFVEKPLLMSYGFLRGPIEYFTNREMMAKILGLSEVISGFFYRMKEDIRRDLRLYDEALTLAKKDGESTKRLFNKHPILVRLIEEDQVDRLFEISSRMESYVGKNNLVSGALIMLKNYPFEGMLAYVIEINGNTVRLELQESSLIIHQDIRSLVYLYSDYLDL